MSKTFIFDTPDTLRISQARQRVLQEFLSDVKPKFGLETALDVGCGVGHFSQFLRDSGFRVSAVDGRKENVEEAARRIEGVQFRQADAEDPTLPAIGSFDFVLCFGLLYHLENPFRVIRNLFAMTGKILILESMCIPEHYMRLYLFDEANLEDQGLGYVAFYPSESCLIKMMYRAGFPFVYRIRQLPDHEQFRDTSSRKRSRTMLVGSRTALDSPALALTKEPGNTHDPWSKVSLSRKATDFLRRPWKEKVHALWRRTGVSAE